MKRTTEKLESDSATRMTGHFLKADPSLLGDAGDGRHGGAATYESGVMSMECTAPRSMPLMLMRRRRSSILHGDGWDPRGERAPGFSLLPRRSQRQVTP